MLKDLRIKFSKIHIVVAVLFLVLVAVLYFGNNHIKKPYSVRGDVYGDKDSNVKLNFLKDKISNKEEAFKNKKEIKVLLIGDEIVLSPEGEVQSQTWVRKCFNTIESKHGMKARVSTVAGYYKTAFGAWAEYMNSIEKAQGTYDIAIVCLGKNERNYGETGFKSAYEALIRKLMRNYYGIHVILVGENSIQDEGYYTYLKKLKEYYNIDYLNMKEVFAKSGKPINEITNNEGYPQGAGYEMYAGEVAKIISGKIEANEFGKYDYQPPLFKDSTEFDQYIRINSLGYDGGNTENKKSTKVDLFGYRYFFANIPGESFETALSGTVMGIDYLATTDSGMLKVYIDDKLEDVIDLYNPFNAKKQIFIKKLLPKGSSQLRLEVSNEKNPNSFGNNIYLFGLISNIKDSEQ